MKNTKGLALEQVSFHWKDQSGADHPVLDNVNLHIAPHEFVAIMGKSGCGKTTLLHLLAGIVHATTGTASHDGHILEKPTSRIGMVFQDYSLFPWMTAGQNIAFGFQQQNISKTARQELVAKLLEQVGLSHVADKYPHELSGGMRQRIAIARAIAGNADYILMDEPFGALDHATRVGMQKFLRHIWQTFQKTIVFVTHNVDEALELASRVLLMKAGAPMKEISFFEETSGTNTQIPVEQIKAEILNYIGIASDLKRALPNYTES